MGHWGPAVIFEPDHSDWKLPKGLSPLSDAEISATYDRARSFFLERVAALKSDPDLGWKDFTSAEEVRVTFHLFATDPQYPRLKRPIEKRKNHGARVCRLDETTFNSRSFFSNTERFTRAECHRHSPSSPFQRLLQLVFTSPPDMETLVLWIQTQKHQKCA